MNRRGLLCGLAVAPIIAPLHTKLNLTTRVSLNKEIQRIFERDMARVRAAVNADKWEIETEWFQVASGRFDT